MNSMDQIFIVVGLLGLLFILIIVLYAFLSANNRKQYASEILNDVIGRKVQKKQFVVRYYSEDRFNKILKIYPWEGYGILYFDDKNVVYWGKKGKKEIKVNYPISDTKIEWIGKKIPNGVLFWFRVSDGVKTDYYTSETGISFLNSEKLTYQIFSSLKRELS